MYTVEAHADDMGSVCILKTIGGDYRVVEIVDGAQVSKMTISVDIATNAFVAFARNGFRWHFQFNFTRFQSLRLVAQVYPSGLLQFLYLRGLLIDGAEEIVLPTSVPQPEIAT